MKQLILYLFLFFTVTTCYAQSDVVTGKVSDSNGKPVSFAFIVDKQNQNATYSDSTGNFKIKAQPSSVLVVSGTGYLAKTVTVEDKSKLDIILTSGTSADPANTISNTNDGLSKFETHTLVVDNLANLSAKSTIDATRGSRYLLQNWAHGYVTTPGNEIIQDAHSLFNYDKVNGSLLMSHDKTNIIEVNDNQVKQFVLFDGDGLQYTFENIPLVTGKHYAQVLVNGQKYKLYKLWDTRFEKANFSTNGISTTGHNYDEYTDQSKYFVLKAGGEPKEVLFRKKSLKNIFGDQGEKLNQFFSSHEDKDIDESYLVALVNNLNR